MAPEVAPSNLAPDRAAIAVWAKANFEPLGGTVEEDRQFVEVELPAANIRKAARIIRENREIEFSLLYDISGLHWPDDEEFEAVYHFFGGWHAEGLVLRTRVPEANPVIPSISEGWPTANWHERETTDLFLIQFEGHPYPEPLLLEKDMQGALLKHYPQREAPDIVERFKARGESPFQVWKPVRGEIADD